MKIARIFAGLFAAAGLVLMLGTVGLCLANLDAPVKVDQIPEGAVQRSQELMDAVSAGDYQAVSAQIYGQPDLGFSGSLEDSVSDRFWQAYLDSLSYEFLGDCYVTDAGFARQVRLTALDLPAMVQDMQRRCHDLLQQRVEAATEMEELYDEENNFRQDLIDQVMDQAVEEALQQEHKTVSYDVVLDLVLRDGQWWAVPNQALLVALSGGIG